MTRASSVWKVVVKHANTARLTTGTISIDDVTNIRRTTDVAEMFADTSADPHPTVPSCSDEDDFTVAGGGRTSNPEVLGLTVRMITVDDICQQTSIYTNENGNRVSSIDLLAASNRFL